jgi:membrane protease YdiL (CAAX protease family)
VTKLVKDIVQVALAGLAAFAITAVGQGLWGVTVMANVRLTPAIPWAALVMVPILIGLAAVLSGRWPPWAAARARRALAPLAPVSRRAWLWSLVGGAAGVVALGGLWTAMASLVHVPPNRLPPLAGVPPWSLAAFLLVAIVAAPVTEEIAFRGYAMGLLRRRFGPATALLLTSLLFAAAHLTQGPSVPKLVVYFLVGLALGFIVLRTGSLLPAMLVHSFGDLVFFTTVWTQDAGRRLVSEAGVTPGFVLALALIGFGAPACFFGLRGLVRATGDVLAPT